MAAVEVGDESRGAGTAKHIRAERAAVHWQR
jgi:hypothetical protein